VTIDKKLTHRKDAKNAKQIIVFVIKYLRDLCVFAVKMVFRDEHGPGLPSGGGAINRISVNDDMSSAPRVWVVTGYRAGERAQVLALAEALGWPFEVKELDYRPSAARISLFRGSSLRGFRMDRSSPLTPPWPDLVITAGMRNEPACRWIREQSAGRTRIVHIGRPWARLEQFDLVITTPQYRLPERTNVLHNNLTLHRVTVARLQAEARRWESRLAALPRPRIAVVAGGDSGPTTFGPRAAARLARQASAMAQAQGGSLLVTTSARTAPAAVEALSAGIQAPVDFYRWRRNDDDNPYFAYLALADAIIVTADSISMLTEACATGKPVYMFDADRPLTVSGRAEDRERDFRLSGTLYRWLMRWGPNRLSRDIGLVHRRVLERRHAVWLGETFPDGVPPPLRDLERALARVRALFAGQAEPAASKFTAETQSAQSTP
jgi:mitochondrial fission protein ELM1